MSDGSNLNRAKKAKEDEFYTQRGDIERELWHYRKHFKGKTVYLNCDDHTRSEFWRYFSHEFEAIGLKRLIATSYRADGSPSYWMEYTGDKNGNKVPDAEEITMHALGGNGDFRSPECVELLKQADIVVTNPPFSLFREFVAQMVNHDKKFLVIGNQNDASCKGVFELIMANKVWLGHHSGHMEFVVPDHYAMRENRSWRDADGTNWRSLGNACWYTNLKIRKRSEVLDLVTYRAAKYPTYDNYAAIEVGKVVNIPDYDGVMGVPITFLAKHNPEQFEIVGITAGRGWAGEHLCSPGWPGTFSRSYIAGRRMSARVLIQKRAAA